jgi:FixJ family two-component response regulator
MLFSLVMAEHMSESLRTLEPRRNAMSDEPPSIVVIDDDPSIRQSLDNLFRSVGFVVELFASPQEFLQSSRPDRPGCIILDVRFPGRSGLEMQQELASANIQQPIIFITGYGDIPMSVRAMKAGAIEFLTKPFRDQDLLDAVGTALDKDRTRRADETRLAELRTRFDTLTARERQVLGLVVAGRLNKQIAGDLGVSEMTVKMHRRQVMRKMQATGVAQLVRLADQLGIAGPPPA